MQHVKMQGVCLETNHADVEVQRAEVSEISLQPEEVIL